MATFNVKIDAPDNLVDIPQKILMDEDQLGHVLKGVLQNHAEKKLKIKSLAEQNKFIANQMVTLKPVVKKLMSQQQDLVNKFKQADKQLVSKMGYEINNSAGKVVETYKKAGAKFTGDFKNEFDKLQLLMKKSFESAASKTKA